jgi:UDP-N-acetylmuramate--alanine ligase
VPELDADDLARRLGQPGLRAHFVGVGGAGMAPLASIVAARGWRVSGCDLGVSDVTRELQAGGIPVAQGHDPSHVAEAELVVASSAVPADAPEVAAARAAGLPIVKRAALTGGLTRTARALCVAGTHGKTTTTSLAAVMLLGAGVDASVLVGSAVPGIGVGGRSGGADVLVVESDEFDRSFLNFRPYVALVQNVEADHLDYYGDLAAIDEAFRAFLALVPPGGRAIVGRDDAGAMRVAPPDATTFGLGEGADWRAIDLRQNEVGGTDFAVAGPGGRRFSIRLAIPGEHNVRNALAAAAAIDALGVDPAVGAAALADFRGPRRRFELRGEVGGVAVYDDYAHNPTKVRAALAGARTRTPGRLWCLFQPHTYHRTWSLFDDFARSFGEADRVLVLPIYSPAGREQPIPEVSSERLVAAMGHASASAVGSFDEAIEAVVADARPGDLVVTMGAGDVTRLAPALVERLAGR